MAMIELIFVHGTWSSPDIWRTEFGSRIAGRLGYELTTARFPWSGWNTVSARETAAGDFIKFVNTRDSETAQRVVICHSHGGSVVMRALARDPQLPIDALVCIGTPFIHVSRLQEVVPGSLPPLRPVAAVLSMVFVLLLARVLSDAGYVGLRAAAAWAVRHPLPILAWLFVAYSATVIFVVIMWIREREKDKRLGRSDFEETDEWVDNLLREPNDDVWALKKRCQLPDCEAVPTLLIKTPGDEAHGALAAAQMVSLLARSVYNAPLRVLPTDLESEEDGFLKDVAKLVLASIAYTWRAFASIPIVAITAAVFLPFGIEFSRLAGRVFVAIGDTPPGRWTIAYLSPFDRSEERAKRSDQYRKAGAEDDSHAVEGLEKQLRAEWDLATRGMAHSRGYSDFRSAELIATWLKNVTHTADGSFPNVS